MDPDTLRRSRALGVGAFVGPLIVVALLAGVLAWQAHRAADAHRATARATVQDHVDFAAQLLEAELERVMVGTMFYAFAAERRSQDALPRPEVFLEDPQEVGRCAHVYGPAERFFFRVLLPDGALEIAGTAGPEVRTWLADTVPAHAAAAYPEAHDYAHLFAVVGGRRHAVAYRIRRDTDGEPVAAYGLNTCFADHEGPFLSRLTGSARLLPPALTGETPADSLLSVTVTDPTGAVLHRSAPRYRSDFVGAPAARDPDPFGGLRLAVTLRPEAADRLVIGGVPRSRMPLLLGVLALMGVLAALSLVQLLRTMELVRVRERFIDDVSHELRTPLQQILLFLQLVRLGRTRSDEERDRAIEIAERETGRLIRLVENVLEFGAGHVRAGGDGTRPESLTLAPLVEELLEAFEPLAGESGVRIDVEVPEDVEVVAAAGAVRQVLLNLLENAVKYGPEGQTVRIVATARDDIVTICVDDEGPGIPPGERERIFRPFHRLEREVRSAKSGSGLGLSVAHRLASRMGGRIEVGEAPGGGARFMVDLPRVEGTAP